jgi:moderate conductance mechanosensitive channel
MLRLLVVLILWLLCLAGSGPLAAQTSNEDTNQATSVDALLRAFPEGMTPAQLDAVLSVMPDDAVRAALRDRILSEQTARRDAAQPVAAAESLPAFYKRRLSAVAAAYPRLPQAVADAFARPNGGAEPIGPIRLVLSVVATLLAGAVVMVIVHRALAPLRARLIEGPAEGHMHRLGRLALRLLFDIVDIAAFLVGMALAFLVLSPDHPVAPALLFIVMRAATIILVVDRVVRALYDPGRPALRFIQMTDEQARGVHRVMLTAVTLTVLITAVLQIFAAMGLPADALVAIAIPLSIVPSAYLLTILWRRRAAITAAIAARLGLDLAKTPALGIWPVLATVYLAGLWLVVVDALLRQQPGVGTKALASLLLLIAVPIVARLIQRPLIRAYGIDMPAPAPAVAPASLHPVTDEFGDELPRAEARVAISASANPATRLMRAVWVVLIVSAIVLTAWIWGFDPERHVGVGGFAVKLLFDVGVILLLGYVGWALIARAIDRTLWNARREGQTTRAQRLATLLPLARKFLKVVLIVVIGMIVLSSLGVDIGPLLAGAGVVGLAVGLGAQQTIADILAGVFFLLEDAFHVGDYVEVGNLKGTVESISLRSLKLRHQRGAVHTLPFGQMKSLTNHTRDWSLVRLEFRVAPETDVALVKRLIKDISKDFMEDPELAPGFIEPLKSQGIRSVEDGAITIGVKYITKPGKQFIIRREAYSRIIAAFRANSIELIGRGVVVRVEGPEATSPVAGAAAAEAVRQQS